MQNDPYRVFDNIFGNFEVDPNILARIQAQKKSVLDFVKDDLATVRKKIAAADQERVESHLDAIRRLENKFQNMDGLETCSIVDLGERIDPTSERNFPAIATLQLDLMVRAMACDLTRVGVVQFSRATSTQRFPWLNITEAHHDLSHEPNSNTDAQNALTQINKYYAEQMAYLIDALKAVPEGNGTMFDNTVIVWGNSLGQGNSHTRNDIPVVIAGSCGGFFETGRYLELDQPHNNLLVSICQAMGLTDQTFGHPDYCDGPMSQLHA